MGLLDRASDHLLTSVVLLVVSGSILAVSILGIAGWVALALLGVGTGALGSLLPLFVVALVLSLPLTVLAGIFAAVGLASRASSAVGGGRTKQLASYVERESDVARAVGLSDLVERYDARSPAERADDRIERLQQRYVDGELTESEFERRLRDVVDQEGVDREGVDRERSSIIDEQLREGRRERE